MKSESSAAKGALILSIAGILTKVISVFYVPLLNGILTDTGYGVYRKSTEVFLFVYALTCMGAQPAVAKVVTELTALNNHKGAIRALKLSRLLYAFVGGLLGILMILLATPLANLAKTPSAAYGIMALGPCIFITSILATYRGYLQGKSNMTAIGVSQILEQILNVIVSLLCAATLVMVSIPEGKELNTSLGSAGGQIGTSIGALFACFFLIYIYKRKKYERDAFEFTEERRSISDKRIIRKIITYSIPITLSAGLQNFGGLVDMFNVSNRLMSIGLTEEVSNALYGLYGKYTTLYGVPLVIITALATTALPSIARDFVLSRKKEVNRKVSYTFKLTYIVAIPAAVGLSILSSPIYISLFGTTKGSDIMTFGAFILVIMATTQIQCVILQGINKLYYIIGTFILGIVVKIILNYIFVGIESINIYGVLIGNCFWHLIPAILIKRKICSTLKIKMSLIKLMIKPLLSSLVMGIVLIILKLPLPSIFSSIGQSKAIVMPITILLVAMGGFIYLYIMILIRGISYEDINNISPKIVKIMPNFMSERLL